MLPLGIALHQQRRLQTRIAADEQLLRLNFEHAPVGMLLLEPDRDQPGRLVVEDLNDAACAVLGESRDGVLGRGLGELVTTDEQLPVPEDGLVGSGPVWRGRATVNGPSGNRVDLVLTSIGSRTDGPSYSAQLLDVTRELVADRQVADARQLAETHDRHRRLRHPGDRRPGRRTPRQRRGPGHHRLPPRRAGRESGLGHPGLTVEPRRARGPADVAQPVRPAGGPRGHDPGQGRAPAPAGVEQQRGGLAVRRAGVLRGDRGGRDARARRHQDDQPPDAGLHRHRDRRHRPAGPDHQLQHRRRAPARLPRRGRARPTVRRLPRRRGARTARRDAGRTAPGRPGVGLPRPGGAARRRGRDAGHRLDLDHLRRRAAGRVDDPERDGRRRGTARLPVRRTRRHPAAGGPPGAVGGAGQGARGRGAAPGARPRPRRAGLHHLPRAAHPDLEHPGLHRAADRRRPGRPRPAPGPPAREHHAGQPPAARHLQRPAADRRLRGRRDGAADDDAPGPARQRARCPRRAPAAARRP